MHCCLRHATPLLVCLCFASALSAVDYLHDIKPLLLEKCSSCHGALKQESGLRLDAGVLIRTGGDSGAAVEPGNPKESLIIQRITAEDPWERMPPQDEGEPLSPAQINLLSQWIAAGSPSPDDEVIPQDPAEHWAYQPPVRPPLRKEDLAAGRQPIDLLIEAKLESRGLAAAPRADRRTLVRRAYLDVLGLPPTPQQVAEFLQDDSADAWPRLVDRLLEDPAYGERWGRHWMDVWRYSDWDGYKNQLRGSARHIWRWRDWIVRSLCEDKGYDQMIVEMLAADEIAPTDLEKLAATGFLARNYHHSNRNIWLDATVEHTAKAFLAMTINCARCHDHKYDPLVQQEYYQMRAIFEPHEVRTERLRDEPNVQKDGVPRAFDAQPAAETYLYLAGNEKHPDKENPLAPAIPAILGSQLQIEPVALPREAVFPSLRRYIEREQLAAMDRKVAAARTAWQNLGEQSDADEGGKKLALQRLVAVKARLAATQARWTAEWAKSEDADDGEQKQLAKAAAAAERLADVEQGRLDLQEAEQNLAKLESEAFDSDEARAKAQQEREKTRNEAAKKLQEAEEKLAQDDAEYTPLSKVYPRQSTGRRLALARWITAPDNPLTARVAVNHIWLRYFGQALVENTFDFGLRSPRPLHADVLDWLAVELVENGWSMKHIHRQILNSDAYQRTSGGSGEVWNRNLEIDQDNHYFWRRQPRRLEAEAVRDSMLHLAGMLDLARGGPEIPFAEGERVYRRSIYLQHAYEKQNTMLVLFDAANPNDCYRRSESVIPQQALALANSDLAVSASRALAKGLSQRLGAPVDDDTHYVELAFKTILCRPCTPEERTACLAFLQQQVALHDDPSALTSSESGGDVAIPASAEPRQRARESLVHVLLNHNDFVTVR